MKSGSWRLFKPTGFEQPMTRAICRNAHRYVEILHLYYLMRRARYHRRSYAFTHSESVFGLPITMHESDLIISRCAVRIRGKALSLDYRH